MAEDDSIILDHCGNPPNDDWIYLFISVWKLDCCNSSWNYTAIR